MNKYVNVKNIVIICGIAVGFCVGAAVVRRTRK